LVAAFSAMSASAFFADAAIGLSSSSAAIARPATGISIEPKAMVPMLRKVRRSILSPEFKLLLGAARTRASRVCISRTRGCCRGKRDGKLLNIISN